MHICDAQRILNRHRRDRGHGVAAKRGDGFDVGLDARAAAGIRTGDDENAALGLTFALRHEPHMADLVRISKTLSYWLRHRPGEAGLSLDAQGWADVDSVLAALAAKGLPGDIDSLLSVVEENDKQRFELTADLDRIRARQGHSVGVDLALAPTEPPAELFHGTVEHFLNAILREGLRKMRRHHVHLSPDMETARRVGARRGAPVILTVNASLMRAEGHPFYVTDNRVWLTDHVPPQALRKL